MGKNLKRLTRWLPWADRAVGAPGAVGDWKGLLKSLWPGGGLVPLWFEAVRGWIVGNTIPEWVLIGLAYLGMGTTAVMLYRWAVRQHRAAQAVAEKAKREAEEEAQKAKEAEQEALRAERADAAFRQLRRETWHIASDDDIHPDVAVAIVACKGVGQVLGEEFMAHHAEDYRGDPARITRDLFLRWLVTYRNVPEVAADTTEETPDES